MIAGDTTNTAQSARVTDASIIDGIIPVVTKYKIAIAGAGSIGTVLGLLLSRQGHEVTLIRKREPFGIIAIDMVGIENFSHKITVVNSKATKSENEKITPNLIFLTSQRQQLVDQLNDLIGTVNFTNDPIIVATQNGLGTSQVVCNWINRNQLDLPLIQCIIWWSATLIDSNLVLYHSKAITTIGIPSLTKCQSAQSRDIDLIDSLLSDILEVKLVDIDNEPYVKLILNVVSPVLALVKQPYPTGVNDFNVRTIIRKLFEEVMEIGKSEGWNIRDERLENFYQILKSEEILDHYSLHGSYPVHKVSSQISAEKYGGKGSNASELLGFFVSKGAPLCTKLLELFLTLEPNYSEIRSDELKRILGIK